METIEAIKKTGIAPAEFWYLSTLILTGILVLFIGVLIFFVKSFFNELKGTINTLSQNVIKLTTMTEVHEAEIKNIKSNLEKRRR